MNKVILSGRLTKDCEIRATKSGRKVAVNTLAIKRTYKNQNGEYDTDFIDFEFWGDGVDNMQKYSHKGDYIEIVGRIEVVKYQDKNGNKREDKSIKVESWNNTTPKKQETEDVLKIDPSDDLPF